MEPKSKFRPVFGSDDAINSASKVSGKLYFSKSGAIYLDTDNGARIRVADKAMSKIFTQTNASTTWTIKHDLGRFPTIVAIDGDGNELVGDVKYTDENNITITFSTACSGKAYMN